MDPNIVSEQLALQMQIYAPNHGGMVSDATFPFVNYILQGLSTIPGRFYRRVMCLVGDVVAYWIQQRAYDRAPVVNSFR